MTGIVEIELGGEKRPLRFNNYARIEIAKNLLPKDGAFDAKPEPDSLIKTIGEMASNNNLLLMRIIVFAGVCGHSYIKSNSPYLTMEEVGELIAEASDDELYKAWLAFLESEGQTLAKDESREEVSKKKSATKKS